MSVYSHYEVPSHMADNTDISPLSSDDMQDIPIAEIAYRGICSDHIDSGNDFIENGIKQIMTKTFVIERTIPNERDKTDEDKAVRLNLDLIQTT